MEPTGKQKLPLNFVRSFESAARNLSFTAAARELGYTQAAVSSHVRALEHYLGWSLFVRYPRSLKLTEMGEAFLPTLRSAIDQIEQATQAIITKAHRRLVSISCPVSLAENWLAPVLADFRKKHPDIELLLHGTVWQDPNEPKADLTMSVCRYDARPQDAQILWEDELVILCAPDLMKGQAKGRAAAQLAGCDRIHVMGRQDCWRIMAQAVGLDEGSGAGRITTNSTNIALELAARGGGLVAAQLSIARSYMQRGLLIEPFRLRRPSPWSYYMTESDLARGPHVKLVRNWILARASETSSTSVRGPTGKPGRVASSDKSARPARSRRTSAA